MRKWLSASAVLLLLAVVSVPVFNLTRYSPATTVSRYLNALAGGNGATARGLVLGPDLQNTDGMTDEVIGGAQGVPTQIKTDVEESGDTTARVRADYVLGSKPHSTVFTLERIPRTWGLFSQWRIRVEDWPTLSVQGPQAQAANINSQPMANGTNAVPVLFPLQYGVGFNQKYVKSGYKTVDVVEPGEEHSVTVDAEPTPALSEEAQTQLRRQLEDCTKQKVLMPTGCVFGYETDNTILGDVHWELKSVPDVELVRDPSMTVSTSLSSSGDPSSGDGGDSQKAEQAGGLRMRPAEATFIISGNYRDSRTGTETDFREEVTELISARIILAEDGKVRVEQIEP